MKKSLLLICALISFHSYSQDLSGKWVWDKNNKQHTFSINLEKNNESYFGTYCAVAMSGNRIDCSPEKYANKFIYKPDNPEFEYTPNYSRGKGIAKLSFVDNKLLWEIVQGPNSMHFAPKKAYLTKQLKHNK
jgi:hypothetical protein